MDLDAVQARYVIAREAGRDADEAHSEPWTQDPRFRALLASWQDVAALHDEVRRLQHIAGQRAPQHGRFDRAALRGKTVALDFDGPLHSYRSGWTGYTPEDPPTDGAQVFCRTLIGLGATLFVVTSRADRPEGVDAVRMYLDRHGFPRMNVTNLKVAAVAYVDDRAVLHRPGDSWAATLDCICALAEGPHGGTR